MSLFDPDLIVVDHCRALLKQVGRVVAVNDGSPGNIDVVIDQLRELGCEVSSLSANSGIATALNAGMASALSASDMPQFILTMDQDSLLEDGYTEQLLAAYDTARAAGISIGMVAPGSVSGLPTRRRRSLENVAIGGEPIQSGLLIPVDALQQLGPLMDELFIDGVDTEYYLRARNAGMESVLAEGAHLGHALGAMTQSSILGFPLSIHGKPLTVRTAASYRYYYIFRNRMLLVRRYWKTQPTWAAKSLIGDCRHLLIVTILAPNRQQRLRNAFNGIIDGIQGRSGPRPSNKL